MDLGQACAARGDGAMTLLQHLPVLGIVDFGVWDALRVVLLLMLVALLVPLLSGFDRA